MACHPALFICEQSLPVLPVVLLSTMRQRCAAADSWPGGEQRVFRHLHRQESLEGPDRGAGCRQSPARTSGARPGPRCRRGLRPAAPAPWSAAGPAPPCLEFRHTPSTFSVAHTLCKSVTLPSAHPCALLWAEPGAQRLAAARQAQGNQRHSHSPDVIRIVAACWGLTSWCNLYI